MKHATLLSLAVPALVGAVIAPIALAKPDPAAHAAKTNVAVTAREFKFTVSPTTAKAGAITFQLRNAGRIGHDFSISGKKTPVIGAGKSATLNVTLKKGSYRYLCTVPGHAAQGMQGTLRVT